MRIKNITDKQILETRKKVLAVLKELRRSGYIALANFTCCQKCAQNILINRISSLSAGKAAQIKGCVFWHQQDERFFHDSHILRLSYGTLYSPTHGLVGEPSPQVGNMLVEKLRDKGLNVEWSGDIHMKVNVIARSKKSLGTRKKP